MQLQVLDCRAAIIVVDEGAVTEPRVEVIPVPVRRKNSPVAKVPVEQYLVVLQYNLWIKIEPDLFVIIMIFLCECPVRQMQYQHQAIPLPFSSPGWWYST